ncbi:MAG: pantoate--beta-alanine ligase [Cytophagaceae bacterium]|nr:pantoate--beta-alanine ligase [Cytophagaceae bacterium]
MQVFTKRHQLESQVANWHKNNLKIGYVPTMGALHAGHASLVEQAIAQCDRVVVGIFVNPTQFNNQEDLEKYPRDIEGDVDFLKPFGESIIVFNPSAREVYGNHVKSMHFDFAGLEDKMEGKFRPGHFDGVGTVLKHLFEIVRPDKAFFGEKDFQQLQIVKKLVEIENLDIDIVPCPISRADDGLALSSRNKRLTEQERTEAPFIFKTLAEAKKLYPANAPTAIKQWVEQEFEKSKILQLEYIEIADEDTLETATSFEENHTYRAFIAVFAGDVRLIDNLRLN